MICCTDSSFTLCRSGLLFNTRFLFDFIRINNFYILSPVPRTMLAGQAKWRGERAKKKKKKNEKGTIESDICSQSPANSIQRSTWPLTF